MSPELQLLVIVLALLGFWAIVMRPARIQQRRVAELQAEVAVGDEVIISAGIFGTISQLDDDSVTVEIAPRTEVRVARRAIAGVTRDEPDPGEDEEHNEPEESDEPQDDDAERWQSAFDDEGTAGETSNEEKRG